MDNKKIVGIYRYDDYDKDGNKIDLYCYVEEDMSTGELKYNFTANKDEAVDAIYRYGKENNYKSINDMVNSRPLAFNLNCKDARDVFSKIKMYNYLSNEDFNEFKETKEAFEKGTADDDSLNPDDDEDLDDDYDDSLNPDDAEDLDDDYDETFATKHPKIAAVLNKIPFVKKGKWLEPKESIKQKLPKGVKKLKVAVPYVTAAAVAITGGFGLYKLANVLDNFNKPKTAGTLATNKDNNLDDITDKAKEEAEKKKQEEEAKRLAEEENAKKEAEAQAKAKVASTSTPTSASSNETYTYSGNSSSNGGSSSSWDGGSSSSSQSGGESGVTDTSMPGFQNPNQTIDDSTSNVEQPEQPQEEDKYDNVFESDDTVSVIEGEEDTADNTTPPDQEIDVPAKTDDNETPPQEDNTSDETEEDLDKDNVPLDPSIPEGAIDNDLSYEYDKVIDVEPEELPSPDEVYEFAGGDNVATEEEIKDAQNNQTTTEESNVETVPVEQAEPEVEVTESAPEEVVAEPEPEVEVSEPAPVETVPVEQQVEPVTTEQAVDQAIEAYANGTDGNLVVGADGSITFEENTNTNTIEANGMTK